MDSNHRCLGVGQESLPLDHGTMYASSAAEAVGLEPTTALAPPPVFKTGSSSGRMTSVLSSCGSWNRTNIKTFRASRPTVRRSRNSCSVPGAGIEPTDSWFKVRHHYRQRRPRNGYFIFKSALRESNPPRQLGRLAPLPLGQGHCKRKERESNPQGSSLDCFRDSCHRPLACPSVIKAAAAGIEPASGRVNRRLPVPARAPPQSSQRSWI